ncbi:hypothetical protein J4223_01125 [Candidatus Woesearchaeota archaeon]|nr:hypothetical protein [Candidatus Woesearchaeota archaeon]
MSKCSKENIEKIKSNILRIIFDEAPKAISAPDISEIEVRDKEFILKLLREMEKTNLVKNVTNKFSRKSYWTMTEQAYNKYKELL